MSDLPSFPVQQDPAGEPAPGAGAPNSSAPNAAASPASGAGVPGSSAASSSSSASAESPFSPTPSQASVPQAAVPGGQGQPGSVGAPGNVGASGLGGAPGAPHGYAAPPSSGYGSYGPAVGTPSAGYRNPTAYAAPNGSGPAPWLAAQPGIIPLRPLSIGEIFTGAFASLRANPRSMFLPSLILMSVLAVLGGLISWLAMWGLRGTDAGDSISSSALFAELGSLGSLFPMQLLTTIATQVIVGLAIVTVSRSVLGRQAPLDQVWERTKGRVLPLLGMSLLYGAVSTVLTVIILASVVGSLIFLFASLDGPGDSGALLAIVILIGVPTVLGITSVFFLIRLLLAPAALVLENIGIMASLRRSWALTRGAFWRTFFIMGAMWLITSALLGAVTSIFEIPLAFALASGANLALSTTISTVVALIAQIIILPLQSATISLIYIDQRMRREGLDVELRTAVANEAAQDAGRA